MDAIQYEQDMLSLRVKHSGSNQYLEVLLFGKAWTVLVYDKEEGKEDLTIACGINKWYIGNNKKPGPRTLLSDLRIDFESVVAASATWKYENTLLITFRFPESTHSDTITCTFVGQKITLSFLNSIAASGTEGSDSRKEITGSSII